MPVGGVLSIFAAIVGVAMLWVAVSTPNTAGIISSFGNAFAGGLRAATGR